MKQQAPQRDNIYKNSGAPLTPHRKRVTPLIAHEQDTLFYHSEILREFQIMKG